MANQNFDIPIKEKNSQYTDHQWQAIHESGSNILVSASAGSGKTTVLAERVLTKVLSGVPIDSLLIVTFTEAAASEMKERIEKKIKERISLTVDEQERLQLQQQLLYLPQAYISTLHAFCKRMIDEFGYLLTINQQTKVLSNEAEKNLIFQSIWAEIEEELYTEDAFTQLARQYGNDSGDQALFELIKKIYYFSTAKPDPTEWLDSLNQWYDVANSTTFTNTPIYQQMIKPDARQKIQWILERFDNIMRDLNSAGEDYQKWVDNVEFSYDTIKAVEDSLEQDDYNHCVSLLMNQSKKSWPRIPKSKKDDLDSEFLSSIYSLRENIIADIKQLTESYFFEEANYHLEIMRISRPIISELVRVTKLFKIKYEDYKNQRALIDFNDLEHNALELLKVDQVAHYFKHKLSEVMVDEYQDINSLQESILEGVSRTGDSKNRFMVGDMKQSIYGFRLAEPLLFLKKYQEYDKAPVSSEKLNKSNQKSEGKSIILAENFRSRFEVLNSVNQVFSQLMDDDIGEMSYDEKAHLIEGNRYYVPDDSYKTELSLIVSPTSSSNQTTNDDHPEDNSEDNSNEVLDADSRGLLTDLEKQPDITYMATKIRELIVTEFKVLDKRGEKKAISYRDIAVLVPTRSQNEAIESIFASFGIPVDIEHGDSYFKRSEVTIIVSLLEVIDNPYQDIPLVAVLKSPLYGISDQLLAEIRIKNPDSSFFEAVKTYQRIEGNPLITQFLDDISRWRLLAKQVSLVTFIESIYRETYFPEVVRNFQNGDERYHNVQALIKRAASFEEHGFKGLRAFITVISYLRKFDSDMKPVEKPEQDINSVKVMTIHGSKGLEFPIVFLAAIHKRFNFEDFRKPIILTNHNGLGIDYFDEKDYIKYPSIVKKTLINQQKRKELSEELRKLYVSMTRAREKLFMVGKVSENALNNFEAFHQTRDLLPTALRESAHSFLDWLGYIVPNDDITLTVIEEDDVVSNAINQALNLMHDGEEPDSREEAENRDTEEMKTVDNRSIPNDFTIEKFKDQLDNLYGVEYPNDEATKLAAYQSVSEIKQINVDPDYPDLEIAPFLESKKPRAIQFDKQSDLNLGSKKLSSIERGLLYHEIYRLWVEETKQMKTMDFALAFDSLRDGHQSVFESLTEPEVGTLYRFFITKIVPLISNDFSDIAVEKSFSMVLPVEAASERLKSNQTIDTSDDRIMVHGTIDCFIEFKNQIVLIDYKTDHIKSEIQLKERVDMYTVQLKNYKTALELAYKKPVTASYLAFIRANKVISVE